VHSLKCRLEKSRKNFSVFFCKHTQNLGTHPSFLNCILNRNYCIRLQAMSALTFLSGREGAMDGNHLVLHLSKSLKISLIVSGDSSLPKAGI